MTVQELIEKLKEFEPQAKVLVSGYENGYSEPRFPRVILVEPYKSDGYWFGPFREATNGFGVVVIER